MKTAKPTGLESVREFFRHRSLVFTGCSFGPPESGFIEGVISDPRDIRNGGIRQIAKIAVVLRKQGTREIVLRFYGQFDPKFVGELTGDLAEVLGKNIRFESSSSDPVYLAPAKDLNRVLQEKERKKEVVVFTVLVIATILFLSGMFLIGKYAVPALLSRKFAFSEILIIIRASIFFFFKV